MEAHELDDWEPPRFAMPPAAAEVRPRVTVRRRDPVGQDVPAPVPRARPDLFDEDDGWRRARGGRPGARPPPARPADPIPELDLGSDADLDFEPEPPAHEWMGPGAEQAVRELVGDLGRVPLEVLPFLPRLIGDRLHPAVAMMLEAELFPIIAARLEAAAAEAQAREEAEVEEAIRISLLEAQAREPPPARPVHPQRHVVTKAEVDREETCCICIARFLFGAKDVVSVKCGHLFHDKCLRDWIKDHDSCPFCRANIGDE